MKEHRPICDSCRHVFHAMAPCTGHTTVTGSRCQCRGVWYDETRSISGFCYVLSGTSREQENEAHAACPGKDYPYPCECTCHGDAFSPKGLTPPRASGTLEPWRNTA